MCPCTGDISRCNLCWWCFPPMLPLAQILHLHLSNLCYVVVVYMYICDHNFHVTKLKMSKMGEGYRDQSVSMVLQSPGKGPLSLLRGAWWFWICQHSIYIGSEYVCGDGSLYIANDLGQSTLCPASNTCCLTSAFLRAQQCSCRWRLVTLWSA